MNINIYKGRNTDLNISLVEYPEETRSVIGKSSLKNMKPYIIAGISMKAIFHCHPRPIFENPRDTKVPRIIPAGNQRWRWFNLVVFLSGKIEVVSGLVPASTVPFATPISRVDINKVKNPVEKIVKMMPKT